jgi:hypothetical protein
MVFFSKWNAKLNKYFYSTPKNTCIYPLATRINF